LISSSSTFYLWFFLWLRIKVESKEVVGLFCRREARWSLRGSKEHLQIIESE
jgi:hypothetical protein